MSGTQIEGATALVTRGNRGFGHAMVEELLARGATKTYATTRSPQPQTEGLIVPVVLDVTDDYSVAAAAQAAGDVSSVVSNAGGGRGQPDLGPRREQLYNGDQNAGHQGRSSINKPRLRRAVDRRDWRVGPEACQAASPRSTQRHRIAARRFVCLAYRVRP